MEEESSNLNQSPAEHNHENSSDEIVSASENKGAASDATADVQNSALSCTAVLGDRSGACSNILEQACGSSYPHDPVSGYKWLMANCVYDAVMLGASVKLQRSTEPVSDGGEEDVAQQKDNADSDRHTPELQDLDSLDPMNLEGEVEPGTFQWDIIRQFLEDDYLDDILEEEQEDSSTKLLPFERGEQVEEECQICMESTQLYRRLCCGGTFCDECLMQYCQYKVREAVVHIACPNSKCQSSIHREEIFYHLEAEDKMKFYRFLIDANKDPFKKTCPRCSKVMEVKESEVFKEPQIKKNGLLVVCSECELQWCFQCQAPWHSGISCREYRKGDKLLKSWAKQNDKTGGMSVRNAQKCPRCKVFV